MSDEEKKKNGEYEKPESHEMEGDELEDVSGGLSCMGGRGGAGPEEEWAKKPQCGTGQTADACMGGAGARMSG